MALQLPESFIVQMKEALQDEYPQFEDALNSPSPVSIRYNPAKTDSKNLCDSPIPWTQNGCYLKERISFTADPLFHAGAYYVQEASSMLLEKVFITAFPDELPELVLDLCAAPGGKSTHLLGLMKEEGVLVSNEIHTTRNHILRQNLSRWGHPSSVVTQLSPSAFSKMVGMFDMVVCDAPCSGEGMFRKDPAAIKEWSAESVMGCAQRQEEILDDICGIIRQYGYLLYSTCTYNTSENDEQMQRLINSGEFELVDLDLSAFGATKTTCGWQCYPHKVSGEGFFISLLRKVSYVVRAGIQKNKERLPDIKANLPFPIPESCEPLKVGGLWYLIPSQHSISIRNIAHILPIKSAGIAFGEEKGTDFIPAPELALSLMRPEGISYIEISREDALKYLRCETLNLTADKGWHVVTYQGLGLGWIKAIQGRMNNYFPKNWRIHKELDKLLL